MRTGIFSLFIFLHFNSVLGQNYAEDISSLITEFASLSSYYLKAEISVVGDGEYGFEAWIKNSPFGTHIKTDISEMLVNDNVSIAIDHEEKEIRMQYGNFKEKGKRGKEASGLEMMEELIGENTRVEYVGINGTCKTYIIYLGGGIEKTIVKIDTARGFFKELEIFYDEEYSSVSSYKIKYTEFDKNPDYKRSDFSEEKIVKKNSDGKYVPITVYSGYKLDIIKD